MEQQFYSDSSIKNALKYDSESSFDRYADPKEVSITC